MTPQEIITEALYNIYGTTPPDPTVTTHAESTLRKLHREVQRKVQWWFLRQTVEMPAVTQNVTGWRIDGRVKITDGWKLFYNNGALYATTYKFGVSPVVQKIYVLDPKTLEGESFDAAGVLNAVFFDPIQERVFGWGQTGYELYEYQFPLLYQINTISLPQKPKSDGVIYDGVYYYGSGKTLCAFDLATLTDTTLFTHSLDVSRPNVIGEYISFKDTATDEYIYAKDGTVTKVSDNSPWSYITDGTSHMQWQSWSGALNMTMLQDITPSGVPFHKGKHIGLKMPMKLPIIKGGNIFFFSGDYLCRLSANDVGHIYSITNSADTKLQRVPVQKNVESFVGTEPVAYSDQAGVTGERILRFYPESDEFVSADVIVYNDMADEEDIITVELADYLVKKLTAEVALTTEYAARYEAYSQAAETALSVAVARNCEFTSQDLTPGYSEC